MSTPHIGDIAGVVTDPELNWTTSDQPKPYARAFLVFSDSRYNDQTQRFEEVASFGVEGIAWDRKAEQFVDACQKGTQIWVKGQLATRRWEDQQGNKQSKPQLRILDFRTINKLPNPQNKQGSSGGYQQPTQQQGSGWGNDPWNGTGGGWETPQNTEPPF